MVPRWWERDHDGRWALRIGSDDPVAWMDAAYGDQSLVTRVGTLHADHAEPDDHPEGRPTSSATMPSLVVSMLRYARLGAGLDVLDVGTGAGGLAAYAATRFGARHVTSLDVDPYLTGAAAERLSGLGLKPGFRTQDATTEITGTYDRIIATVGMPPGPGLRPLLGALHPGGRLVTALDRMGVIITGWKRADGDVVGTVERTPAGFMPARSGADYGPTPDFAVAEAADGQSVSTGRYPVLDIPNTWELRSMLELAAPGVEATFHEQGRTRTACLIHPDGSWARASAEWTDPPTVQQSGPRRLWDVLEHIRTRLNIEGSLPLLGARVRITPDGVCHFSRGQWRAAIGA
ncbi:methyltransferase domain-containing protein [Streptomyces qinzhouensis]|uniref:Methyltransferase domain-containing protein n=1 Tax=Streptomyces qinzhouensis TaxID=2599401 RepID=A0A5B8JGZ9_9ACTN|nr:methyltransferase domain-containing protein [Streptomyces qinzhouensis]